MSTDCYRMTRPIYNMVHVFETPIILDGSVVGTLHVPPSSSLASGFDEASIRLDRSVDARYLGQVHELTTPVGSGELTPELFDQVADSFHAKHRERYTYALESNPVEYLHWRVRAVGMIERPPTTGFDEQRPFDAADLASGSRRVWRGAGRIEEVPTFSGGSLSAGARLEGPATVDGATTTIVVDAGRSLLADGSRGFLLRTR